MGRAFNEDERPTSNIQRPTSNEKTNIQYRTFNTCFRFFVFNPSTFDFLFFSSLKMGFALPITFSYLPAYSRLRMKAIPIEQKAAQPILL
jgi:hypothetical protein